MLEPVTTTLFLATVVGTAIGNALKPEAFVASAIGGIIGNRLDAGFVKGFNGLIGLVKGGNPNEQQELQQAISRSVIAAQQGLVKDCLKSAGLSEADRRWLKDWEIRRSPIACTFRNIPLNFIFPLFSKSSVSQRGRRL
jgi:hypothetical protein